MVHHVRCPILFSNSLFWIAPNFVFFCSSSAHGFTATASCRLSAGQLDPGMPIVDEQEVITQNQMGTWMFPNSQREPNGMVGHGGSNFAKPSTCFLFSHLLSLCKTTSMKHNHRAVQKPLLQLRSSRLRAPSCATLGCGLMFPSHPKTLVEQIQWTHVNMSDLNQWPVLWNIEGIGLDLQLLTSSSWRLAAAKLRVMRSKDCWCCVPWQWSSWGWQNGPNMFAGIQLLDQVSQWQGAHFEHKFLRFTLGINGITLGINGNSLGFLWGFFRVPLPSLPTPSLSVSTHFQLTSSFYAVASNGTRDMTPLGFLCYCK